MTDWEAIASNYDEKTGVTDPVIANQLEKTNWEQIAEKYDKEETNLKLREQGELSYADMSWGMTLFTALSNLPSSYYKLGENIVTMLSDLKVTGKAMKNLATGTLKMGLLKNMSGLTGVQLSEEKLKADEDLNAFMLFEKQMQNQYGTEEGFKKTLAEDPATVLNDVSAILFPIAKVLKYSGLTKAGVITEQIASRIEPINLARQIIKTPSTAIMNLPGMKDIPSGLYGRALKLADTIPHNKRQRLIDIAMDNKVELKFKEVERLNNQIKEMNDLINAEVKNITNVQSLKVDDLFKGFDDLAKDLLEKGFDDADKALKSVKKKVLEREGLLGRTELNPVEAQKLKVGLNEQLGKTYQDKIGKTRLTPLKNDFVMAEAKNVREYLEQIIPDMDIIKYPKLSKNIIEKRFGKKISLQDMNRLEGDLIEIRHAIGSETYKLTTGKLMDFQLGQKTATLAFMGGGLTRAFTNDIGTISAATAIGGGLGFTLGVIDSSPLIKSKIANYLHDLQSIGINIKPNATMIRLGLYESAQKSLSQEEE